MFRVRQRLGKYRIGRRLTDGGFAAVYQAMDTVEGIRVALRFRTRSLSQENCWTAFAPRFALLRALSILAFCHSKTRTTLTDIW